ncbi:MAG TPA: nucleotidyltransferase family protein [Chthoniobacterales bacterium]|nr:nucleotidyltransferase family protein [Chthoniobacterales bacterium]
MDRERVDQFYRGAMQTLRDAEVPFLVGGAYALCAYTGISRDTKDFDLFVRPRDVERALDAFRARGFEAERTFPHWLAKAKSGEDCIDLIFRAGNGLCEVDDSWFARAPEEEVLGERAAMCAPEEILWMKCYIMERERYDGADVAHLLVRCAERIDWQHLLTRFDQDWRVLLSHLVLFGFIYPSERDRIPAKVMENLMRRLERETTAGPSGDRVCRGTLLSRAQYLCDVQEWGFRDARLEAESQMTAADVEHWTAAIDESK